MSTFTILVVDDSPTSVHHTTDVLEQHGYRVITAVDGDEALQVAEQIVPDLVLLDIVIPKKNGFQVCRYLKNDQATKRIKIVLLSSKSQDADRFWGRKQGADAYLTKPFDPPELIECIESLLTSDATCP